MARRFGHSDYADKRKNWRFPIFGILTVAMLWWGYQKFISVNLSRANAALAAGDYERAGALFKRVSNLPLTKTRGQDGLGAIALLNDDPEKAKSHFQAVLERKPSSWGGDPKTLLNTFMAKGKYQAGITYKEFLSQWQPETKLEPVYLEFAALALGARQLDIAKSYLEKVDASRSEAAAFKKKLDTIEHQGFIPIMLDRHGAPMIVFDLSSNTPQYASPKIFAGWPAISEGEGLFQRWTEVDWATQIQATVDINLQKAAHQSFGNYVGTMVLIDPTSGEILAAYGTPGLDPFSESFEPGSVIKLLTLGSLLKGSPDLKKYAPKNYPSSITIGGKIFYDWTTQGMLQSVEEGMAVSCNLMFAQMGMDLGWPKLSVDLKRFFDRQLQPEVLPGWASLGRVQRDPEGAYELGRFAIGLDMMASTSLGIALIPAAIANQGTIPHPTLIAGYLNSSQQLIPAKRPPDLGRAFHTENVAQLKASMVAAVNDQRGTARRAKVEWVDAAIKTGTAGERPFDSIMVGMFPVENPKLVFGFFLKGGGKAEINGALVAKNLQEQIKALAPGYLD